MASSIWLSDQALREPRRRSTSAQLALMRTQRARRSPSVAYVSALSAREMPHVRSVTNPSSAAVAAGAGSSSTSTVPTKARMWVRASPRAIRAGYAPAPTFRAIDIAPAAQSPAVASALNFA